MHQLLVSTSGHTVPMMLSFVPCVRGKKVHRGFVVLELLEPRQLLSADLRTIDGTGNNAANPQWGSVGQQLLRVAPTAYGDGISTPAGADRPSARLISNTVVAHPADDIKSDRDLSAVIYVWGQFIDHDLDHTTSATPAEPFDVQVPQGDPSFDPSSTGTQTISLERSKFDPATGTSTSNPRQQVNDITSWLDGSMVYGSDQARADALRSHEGGRLKTSDGNLLPFNTDGLPNANDAHVVPDNQLFLAGDVRANENIELTAMQTLFMREHNRIADQIHASDPTLNDEQVFQQARQQVIGEIQAITFNQFLPALLGSDAVSAYSGYKSDVNPNISTEFSTAAFRIGHSLLGNDIEFFDNNGQPVRDPVSLSEAFFNPQLVSGNGIDPILKYMASDKAEEVDTKVVDSLRNFLFGAPGSGGLDLASMNIQRGRDHGLADYNSMRAAFGLPRVATFDQITSDPELQGQLKSLYGSVDSIDAWVGGLAEDHVAGSSTGPLFRAIIADQFTRLRDGDSQWYQNVFKGKELKDLDSLSLSDVIARNSSTTNLQQNPFFFEANISGTVFNDTNRNGKQQPSEPGLGDQTVQLLDDSGTVLTTVQTAADGSFKFSGLDLDTFNVKAVIQPNWTQTSADPPEILVTKGQSIENVNFGEVAATPAVAVA